MIFLITILAIATGGFGVFCNVIFYSSLGTGFYAITWGCMGFISDMIKFASVKFFGKAILDKKHTEIVVTIIFFIIASIFSLFAGFGFTSTAMDQYENRQLQQSNKYKAQMIAKKNASNQREAFVEYASPTIAKAAETKLTKLENDLQAYLNQPAKDAGGRTSNWIGSIARRTGDCFGNGHYINTYCPTISKLNKDIKKQQAIIDGHHKFVSTSEHLENVSFQLSELKTSGSSIHSVYNNAGWLLGVEGQSVKICIIAGFSVFMEFASSYLFLMLMRLFGVNQPQVEYSSNGHQIGYQANYQHNGYRGGSQMRVENHSINRRLPKLFHLGNPRQKLFKKATKALNSSIIDGNTGELTTVLIPSKYGIKKWADDENVKVPRKLMKEWQEQWLKMGLIVEGKSRNGKDTYLVAN